MTNMFNILRYTPKQIAIFAATLLALISSVAAVATTINVFIEGDLKVRNVTEQTNFNDFVNATDDNVVEFRVHYHNTELPSSNKVAENLSVKVDFPTQPGSVQEVMATIRGDNTNTVVDTASVNLGNEDAYLEFIPGTVKWERNTGTRENISYTTTALPDSVVTGDGFVEIEDLEPCFEYEAWIYFRAYVRTPDVEIEKSASVDNGDWMDQVDADGDEVVKYLLTVKNKSQATLKNVVVRDELPAHQSYVAGTSKLFNNANPNGTAIGDGVVTANGINIGEIGPGQVAYVGFHVKIDSVDKLECGVTNMVNKAFVTAGSKSDDDTAKVAVDKTCEQEEPVYECTALATIVDMSDRKVSAELEVTKSDAVTVTGYSINFGDGTVVDQQTADHTYSEDGTYQIIGTVSFDVNGETKTATCNDSVSINVEVPKCEVAGKTHLDADDPACRPDVLPNTGPGNIIAALFGTSAAAASVRTWLSSRSALKQSLLA